MRTMLALALVVGSVAMGGIASALVFAHFSVTSALLFVALLFLPMTAIVGISAALISNEGAR